MGGGGLCPPIVAFSNGLEPAVMPFVNMYVPLYLNIPFKIGMGIYKQIGHRSRSIARGWQWPVAMSPVA